MRVRARAGIRAARLIDAAMARAGVVRPLILVSGFWRSGTTWLQECLAEALDAKTVFEPLSPLDPARGAAVARRFPGDEDAAQAFIPAELSSDEDVWTTLDHAMSGRADSSFALSCRWSLHESFRRAVVVKDVRLQCNLALVHARYGIPVVHVRRHPCAVVASLLAADWHWSFARVRLAELLPAPANEKRPGADPRAFDDDATSRIAAVWAWSEGRAAASLEGTSWGRLFTYEDLARDPEGVFAAICTGFGLRPKVGAVFDRPSASIHPDAFAARSTTNDRWRRLMSTAEIERIERIADAVYPGWREAWSRP